MSEVPTPDELLGKVDAKSKTFSVELKIADVNPDLMNILFGNEPEPKRRSI